MINSLLTFVNCCDILMMVHVNCMICDKRVTVMPGGSLTKNLKIMIHTWDIFILFVKHHQCHCMPTNCTVCACLHGYGYGLAKKTSQII